jgi:tRNA (cmo5U34)-methyltransferase
MYKPGEAFMDVADYDAGIRKIVPYYDLMQDILCSMVPDNAVHVLELGSGTGELTEKILRGSSTTHVLCIDYSDRMLEYMKKKIQADGQERRVHCIRYDFRDLDRLDHSCLPKEALDACVSMLAVHHLNAEEKSKLIRSVYSYLKPGGHFWIADVLLPAYKDMECYYSSARDCWKEKNCINREIIAGQMITPSSYSEQDCDKPDTIQAQLKMFEDAGFRPVDILWKYFGMGIWGGIK